MFELSNLHDFLHKALGIDSYTESGDGFALGSVFRMLVVKGPD